MPSCSLEDQKDWIVRKVTVSKTTAGLCVDLINLSAPVGNQRAFWILDCPEAVINPRYDFTDTEWGPGARERYEAILRKHQPANGS